MAEWVPCGSGFIEADVVRWTEGVWHKPRGRRRSVVVGERVVIAEVTADAAGWVNLLVRDCSVTRQETSYQVGALAKNSEIRRKRGTLESRNIERLLWSDEAARALLVKRGNSDVAPDTA